VTSTRLARSLSRLTPRKLRTSIGARVLTGFFFTAGLALAVGTISLVYNRDAGRSLARVTERDREVSNDFRELQVSIEQQTGAVQNFVLSGDDRDLGSLNTGRTRFSGALTRLETNLPKEERTAAFAEISRQWHALDDIAQQEIALYRQGWANTANFLWRTDGQQTKQALLSSINRQIEDHSAAIDREIDQSQGDLRFAFGASLGLMGLAAVTALLIGLGITRAVTRPVRSLMKVAAAVQRGDFRARAPVTGEDELAVLSFTMNAMVQSLAASRQELEEALGRTERSEQRYRLLTERANDIIFTIDRNQCVTFVNQACQQILGYAPDELIGENVSILYTDDTRSKIDEGRLWTTIEAHSYAGDIEVKAKDGRTVPLAVNSTVIMADGEPAGTQGIARDMTDRIRMENELRHLHEQDERRVEQLVALNDIGRKIAALQQVDTLLPHLAQRIGRTFGYHHVRILLVGENHELTPAAVWRKHGGDESRDTGLSPLVLRALAGDAGFVADSGKGDHPARLRHTEIAVPIRCSSGVLGVLDVRGGGAGSLDESDIFTLQILADQVAVAIENARLYEAGQRLAVSEERNRLARDLHDSVTQELFSMTMIAGALPLLMDRKPDAARERLQRLHDLARGALAEMRALLFALRPASLEDEGLVSALRKHAAAFEHRENVRVNLEIDNEERLPHAVEEALYRVMQEALNNIAKHAQATAVDIHLLRDGDRVRLEIADDGVGMSAAALSGGGMGLRSMRERVSLLGGVLTISSEPGEGACLVADVPLTVSVPA